MRPLQSPTLDGRRWFRWRDLAPLTLIALAPKCLLCAAAYLGGAGAFLLGPEICGPTANDHNVVVLSAVLAPATAGLIMAFRYLRHRNAATQR